MSTDKAPNNLLFPSVLIFLLMCSDIALGGPLRDLLDRRRDNVKQQSEIITLRSGGFDREYILYTKKPSNATKQPLIIVLHGTYGTGNKMQKALGFDKYADKYGFIVAYPDAYHANSARQTTRWNDGRGVLESSELDVDDVTFIRDMIQDIAAKHNLDKKRVFVTGASNGGIMAYRLGCELKAQVRAIAPVIGNIAEPISTICTPSTGVSILSINGTQDPFVPLDGGLVCNDIGKRMCEGGYVISRSDSIYKFAVANDCNTSPRSFRRHPAVDDGTWVEELTYSCRNDGVVVRSLVVHGMGHVWPPRSGQATRSGPTTGNLDATLEIVNFFMSIQ
jgi:polyhydroxybutyrate depolymerase